MKLGLNKDMLEAILEESAVRFTPEIGLRFAQMRKHWLLKSQAEVGESLGVSGYVISNIENGQKPHSSIMVSDLFRIFELVPALYILKGWNKEDALKARPDGQTYWAHRHNMDGRKLYWEKETVVRNQEIRERGSKDRYEDLEKKKTTLQLEVEELEARRKNLLGDK